MAKRSMLYIMSPSYSGSTLLTLLLADHRSIATVGELKASAIGDVDAYFCSCGDRLLDCAFFQQLTRSLAEAGIQFNLRDFGTHFGRDGSLGGRVIGADVRGSVVEALRRAALLTVPPWSARLKRVLARNRAVIEAVCELQGGTVFLDASKDPVRLKHFLDSDYWNVKVVALYRDGRGVAHSYRKHTGCDFSEAVRQWRRCTSEMERISERIDPSQLLRVRYEELCACPRSVLSEIARFAGVDLDYDSTGVRHVLGNNMRSLSMESVRLDERWRHELSDSDRECFRKIGASWNGQLGYV